MNKKSILVKWPGRNIKEIIFPVINELYKKYDFYIIFEDYSSRDSLISDLDYLLSNSYIQKYFILPNYKKILKNFLFFKKNLTYLKSKKFDLFLSDSDMQVNERIIKEIILKKNCKIILMSPHQTYLFMYHPKLAEKILKNNKIDFNPLLLTKNKIASFTFQNKVDLIYKEPNLYKKLVVLYYVFIKNNLIRCNNKFKNFKKRVFYPIIFFRKFFLYQKFDFTQLTSDCKNTILFFDELDSKVHRLLYKNSNIYTVQKIKKIIVNVLILKKERKLFYLL